MNIYLDIETIPCADPAIIAAIHATVTPPKTHKKPETIAAWWADEGEQAKADAVAKTSFDGLYGRIACICWALDDSEVVACANNSESQLLSEFYNDIELALEIPVRSGAIHPGNQVTIVGHNVAGFDLSFLKHRSIINRIRPPVSIMAAMNAKAWDKCIADTMLMWSPDREKRVSMEKLCQAFGIEGKGDFDGSMVAATWPIDPQKVIDYCKGDIERTRQIYKRLTFV